MSANNNSRLLSRCHGDRNEGRGSASLWTDRINVSNPRSRIVQLIIFIVMIPAVNRWDATQGSGEIPAKPNSKIDSHKIPLFVALSSLERGKLKIKSSGTRVCACNSFTTLFNIWFIFAVVWEGTVWCQVSFPGKIGGTLSPHVPFINHILIISDIYHMKDTFHVLLCLTFSYICFVSLHPCSLTHFPQLFFPTFHFTKSAFYCTFTLLNIIYSRLYFISICVSYYQCLPQISPTGIVNILTNLQSTNTWFNIYLTPLIWMQHLCIISKKSENKLLKRYQQPDECIHRHMNAFKVLVSSN